MTVEIGAIAPEFTLKDQAGNDVSLSDTRGSAPTVLVFYPFTFTGVCQGELCEIRDDPSVFDQASAAVLAISCDTRHAQAQWAEQQGFTFPVLSDFWPHGEVARAYGVFNEQLGCANRATFVIDRDGRVVAKFESAGLATPRAARTTSRRWRGSHEVFGHDGNGPGGRRRGRRDHARHPERARTIQWRGSAHPLRRHPLGGTHGPRGRRRGVRSTG